MKKYITPTVEALTFLTQDVITNSSFACQSSGVSGVTVDFYSEFLQ